MEAYKKASSDFRRSKIGVSKAMSNLDIRQILELYGTILPLPILLIENDEDRQFLTDIYLQYKPLMYKTAYQFFDGNHAEVDDAVSSAVERLCKKCETLQEVACNKRASYIVSTVRNVCLTRLRELKRQRLHFDFGPNGEDLEEIEGTEDVQDIVFNHILSSDLLSAFPELSEKDCELIRLRHIDQLEYADIAVLSGISEGAVRTAVSRAKSRLEQLAMERQD
ncbi:MAG TPA: sigma-70 family RNA polymerase sigma factor [Candidatus Limiplasma sp.]|nr:sigma-70 family RNA polymerase sigma factor [Candidatus Limiplasma sp.]